MGKCPRVSAAVALPIDDVIVGNSPTGEVTGLDAGTGAVVYRHTFGRMLEVDVPRRLEPVLRSGALFVPHADIHILRPTDGKILGQVGATSAIPDLYGSTRLAMYTLLRSRDMWRRSRRGRLSLVPVAT